MDLERESGCEETACAAGEDDSGRRLVRWAMRDSRRKVIEVRVPPHWGRKRAVELWRQLYGA